jgi:phosphopentomutase
MNVSRPFQRIVVIVLDGVGAGEAPDAADYGDVGSNSLGNTARAVGGLNLPNLARLGFGGITPIEGVPASLHRCGAFGKCIPRSAGKDTVTGHWELMGIRLSLPFPTYPNGFPADVIEEFERQTGRKTIGNIAASGTAIIQELGEQHQQTGALIVYTSADSVFQIAAHEEIVPVEELYQACEIARDLLAGDHAVGRVIARPFLGADSSTFHRTNNRKDYALQPPEATTLDKLIAAGKTVCTVGKIDDIFAHRGITRSNHTHDNASSCDAALKFLKDDFEGLLFVNLIEFDMIYGHRNDPRGYGDALEAFDRKLPELEAQLRTTDLVIIAADHGVDPTTPGTDHTREHIPLLAFGPRINCKINLGIRETYSDVAATIAENFHLPPPSFGSSFLSSLGPDSPSIFP